MALHFSIQACVTQAHCIRQDPSTTTQQCPRLSWLGKHMPSQLITRESSAANQRSDSLHLQDSSIVASREQKPSCDLNRNNYLKVSQHSHAIMGPVAIASQLPSPKRATAKKWHNPTQWGMAPIGNISKLHSGGQSLATRRLVRAQEMLCPASSLDGDAYYSHQKVTTATSCRLWSIDFRHIGLWAHTTKPVFLPTRKYMNSRLGLATACHNSLNSH